MQRRTFVRSVAIVFCLLLSLLTLAISFGVPVQQPLASSHTANQSLSQAFVSASHDYGVPVPLLQAICYMEGHLSNHSGTPSIDNGFGCMHLIENRRGDMLDQAASELAVPTSQLKLDLATNIRGGAALLRDYAHQLASPSASSQASLANWYGAVAAYSHATTRSGALMYADGVYQLLRSGFAALADDGETIALSSQQVVPNTQTATTVVGSALPAGCVQNASAVDYPGAVDCILAPKTFDCNTVKPHQPCNYESAHRPTDLAIDLLVIHDVEGTAQNAINVFQNPADASTAHYVVDTDGTVYQILHESDIGYHDGNYWYNQHSIGIEHAGFDASGYRWYNAAEYLASAKLAAYLLHKYHIPLDHAHVVAHGTVPSPSATALPNHVDPGPYWLWSYYFALIQKQGVVPLVQTLPQPHVIVLRPASARHLLGEHGSESAANYSFFKLYKGPSTRSTPLGNQADITDVTGNVEVELSYYVLSQTHDQAGSKETMYEIWYGVENQLASGRRLASAQRVWLAAPADAVRPGQGTVVRLTSKGASRLLVYGCPLTRPASASLLTTALTPDPTNAMSKSPTTYVLGNAPAGSTFVSAYTVIEDGTSNLWYEINYNHRQAWVPASEVTLIPPVN